MSHNIKTILKSFLVLALIAVSANALAVWNAPTATAPGANAEPPINAGSTGQSKSGAFVANGLGSTGNLIVDGVTNANGGINSSGTLNSSGTANLTGLLNLTGNLNVNGTIQVTGGSPGAGKVLTATDGTGAATWQTPAGGGGITGVGTTNYVTKWTAGGTALGNSLLFDNGTGVGLGTATPTYKFTIGGNGIVVGLDNNATFCEKNSSGTCETFLWPRYTDNVMYMNYGSGGFNIRNDTSTSSMFMTSAGKIGIGNTAPNEKLDLSGVLHIGDNGGLTTVPGTQGAYIGWNSSGGVGETDLVNNEGGGSGGFYFINTPSSGTPQSTLMKISGTGTVNLPSLALSNNSNYTYPAPLCADTNGNIVLCGPPIQTLTISQAQTAYSQLTCSDSETQTYTASGGVPPYSWTYTGSSNNNGGTALCSSNPSTNGSASGSSINFYNSCDYGQSGTGVNWGAATVTDSDGHTASVSAKSDTAPYKASCPH